MTASSATKQREFGIRIRK